MSAASTILVPERAKSCEGDADAVRCLVRPPRTIHPLAMATRHHSGVPTKANYGIDAPGVVRTMALLGILLVGSGFVLRAFSAVGSRGARFGTTLLWPGASFAITALLMLASSRFGKLRARDRLLDRLPLRGDETVLDIGCGHGLLLRHAPASPGGCERGCGGVEPCHPQRADSR